MSDAREPAPTQSDAELERAVLADRKFSLAEAIGRIAGPGAMKGASPVTRKVQAEAVIAEVLRRHLADSGGVLVGVVLRHVREGDRLLADYDHPLAALAGYGREVLESEFQLTDLVREADAEWGRAMGERPHFDRPGRPPDSDDPYTAESVRASLSRLLESLVGGPP
jgi:hypothetical protein